MTGTNPPTRQPIPTPPPRRRYSALPWVGTLLDFGLGGELLVAVALGVAVLIFGVDVVMGGGDGPDPLEGASIRLEAAEARTPDPFFEAGAGVDAGVEVPAVNLHEPPGLVDRIATGLSGHVALGSGAGLYGSGQGDELCDAQALAEGLMDHTNADRARAWAGVQGIAVEDVPRYVGELTAVRLRYDTRVTNHGFTGGEAHPLQSLLQAGTSVLVDRRGVPRVRCSCGNPLTGPVRADDDVDEQRALDVDELAVNPEDAWEGFDPAHVVTVEPGDEVDVFVVADLATGARSEQSPGTR